MPSKKADDNAIVFSRPLSEVDAWEASEGMLLPNGDYDGDIVMSQKFIDEKKQQIIAARYKVISDGEFKDATSVIDYIYVTDDSLGKVKQWLQSATGKEVKGKKIPDISKIEGKQIRFQVVNEQYKDKKGQMKVKNAFKNYRPYDPDEPAPGAFGGASAVAPSGSAPGASDEEEVEDVI